MNLNANDRITGVAKLMKLDEESNSSAEEVTGSENTDPETPIEAEVVTVEPVSTENGDNSEVEA